MQQIDHRVIKLLIGIIALSLASWTQLIAQKALNSISASYHIDQSRDWFVGLLFAVSALFLSFTGENRLERVLTFVASFLALIIALVPCECGRGRTSLTWLHFPSAIMLLGILGYFCWRFRRTAMSKVGRYPEAKHRVRVYTLCLVGMLGCGAMGAAYAVADKAVINRFPAYIFWTEALGLMSFGLSWLAASRILPVITNSNERFRIIRGSAPDDADKRL